MAQPTTTKRIQVIVNAGDSKEQLRIVADGMKQVNKETKKMATDLGLLSGAFQAFIGYLGVSQLTKFSDEMQNLNSRILLLSASQEEASETMKKLLDLADKSNTSVDSLADIYTRLGVSLKSAGLSSDALLSIVEVLNNSFRVSGSTVNETTATIIQLSQAFASGTLRGQELRSVMLQNATVAGLLRQRFGKNLAEDAEKGLISISEVMKVLLKNQNQINESAKKLTPTFEQTLAKGVGHLKYEIGELNKQFGVSIIFAEAMTSVINNMGLVIIGVATIAVPLLIRSLVLLAASNPVSAIAIASLIALAAAINYTGDSTDTFTQKLIKIQGHIYDFAASAARGAAAVYNFGNTIREFFGFQSVGYSDITENLLDIGKTFDQLSARLRPNLVEVKPKEKSQAEIQAEIRAKLAGGGTEGKLGKVKDALAALNQEFLRGELTVEEYGNKIVRFDLYKLNRSFAEGKINLDAYNKALAELDRKEINRKLKDGAISLAEFNRQISENKTGELNAQLQAGTISLQEFRAELVLISNELSAGGLFATGTQNYLDSLGTTSKQIAEAISGAWKNLETEFTAFIKTGTFNFAKFTEAILDDLLKIVVRATIIQPLAQGLTGLFTPSAAGTGAGSFSGSNLPTANLAAKGAYFNGGVAKFATGGVFNTPTMFKYGGGKTGIMGEAGPEAILPLSRGSGGTLGVQATVTPVTINIVNNTPAEVESRETTGPNGDRQIEVIINNKVKEGIATGVYDKNFQQAYGLKRRGS